MSASRVLRRERFHVGMADVDAAGILYYGTPLRWMERLMVGWMRDIGMPLSAALAAGQGAPAVRSEIDYLAPLRLDDPIQAELMPASHGRSSYTLVGAFRRSGDPRTAVEARVTSVWTRFSGDGDAATMSSAELPSPLRQALAGLDPQPTERMVG